MSILSIVASIFARDNSQSGADLFVGLGQNGDAVFTTTTGEKRPYALRADIIHGKIAFYKGPIVHVRTSHADWR